MNYSAAHPEPIDISFTLENTIKPPITFEDVHLLWTFQPDSVAADGQPTAAVHNVALFGTEPSAAQRAAVEQCVTASHIRCVQLNECERQSLTIRLVPLQTGRLSIDGVVGRLSVTNEPNTLWGRLRFEPLPIQQPQQQSATTTAAGGGAQQQQLFDQKLHIDVVPAVPSLHVQFSAMPDEVLAGEIIAVQVTMTNAGAVGLGDVWAATEHPRWVLGDEPELPLSVLKDYRDLTNTALIRDKEARRQHSFCLLRAPSGSAIAIGPHQTRTTTIHIQAPLRKGPEDVKLLIHYAMPDIAAGGGGRIKYRLVRQAWQLNVNESLALSVSANVGNMHTAELGVDVQVSNLNQVHHPLMTAIVPVRLHLFCGRYELADGVRPVLLQGPGVRGLRPAAADDGTDECGEIVGLRTMESLALRLVLSERDPPPQQQQQTDEATFVRDRLTQIALGDAMADGDSVPGFERLNSFLMKAETKYIGQLGQTGNNELFNQIVTDVDRHATFALTWRATINDNMSQQRVAVGQHFVQLRKLYET